MKVSLETIVIAANFTVEPVFNSLQTVLKKVAIDSDVVMAPYNQIVQQLLDPISLFHNNKNGANIIFLRLEDLIDSRTSDSKIGQNEMAKIKANASDLADWLNTAEQFKVPLFVFVCPLSLKIQADPQLLSGYNEIENSFRESVSNISNLYICTTDHLRSRYQIEEQDNPIGNNLGHIPYTPEFFSALAIETARKIDAYRRKPFKVLVLDCDNTLWDGVVGEDGVRGIGLSENRLFLQNFAVRQTEFGLVVGLCSKNNEADVWEVFDQRTEMPLKKEQVVSSRINWQPKSENLKSMSEELQLGLDSFIFVDDDPAVCSEVQRNCPEVFTVLLPPQSKDFSKFFDHLWVFDKLTITNEDKKRTQSYKSQVLRNQLQSRTGDMAGFLESLQLVCQISEISSEEIPRVSQLSLRTNQFNSTTVRCSESDIRQIISEEKKNIWTVKVSDRFGDYGLVGVVIFEERETLVAVESLMLSCRVLGRGVEHKILQELGKTVLAADREVICIKFKPTAKNIPILNFLTEIGEKYKTSDPGQVVYKIPGQTAIKCSPKMSPLQNGSSQNNGSEKSAGVSRNSFESSLFQTYIEMAGLLSQNKSLVCSAEKAELSRNKISSEFRVAQTQTEKRMTRIWEKILTLKNIGIADNFFEIGGDSLIAVSLFVEIEEEFGKSLPLTSLINFSTIEKLSQSVESGTDSAGWKYMVPIQPEGTLTPLFCMHAAGGNVLFYRDLANELGNDQPLYGLQARGVADKSETAHDRVEDMAENYLREIRSFQPHGPYRLCGSSFGGLVAYEIAKQLDDLGETVSVLALFDTYAPGYLLSNSSKSGKLKPLNLLIMRVKNGINQLGEIGTRREQFEFVFKRLNKLKLRLKRKVLWKKNEFSIQYNKATGRELPTDILRNHKAIQKALDNYDPQPYSGKMILFRASDQPKDIVFDPFLGWRKYTSQEIVTEDVKGTHGALGVYPFASELADKFRRYLSEKEILTASASAATF